MLLLYIKKIPCLHLSIIVKFEKPISIRKVDDYKHLTKFLNCAHCLLVMFNFKLLTVISNKVAGHNRHLLAADYGPGGTISGFLRVMP